MPGRSGIPVLLAASLLAGSLWPQPQRYTCYRAVAPVQIDGRLNDPAWRNAPWTSRFVDIQGLKLPRPRFHTRVRMLWDDQYLYIAAKLQEPDIWAL